MNRILILGGGKSSTFLIDYLADQASSKNRHVVLADLDVELAKRKLKGKANTEAKALDIGDENARRQLIKEADVVISMLPARMHPQVAVDCLEHGKHFFSASYESKEMRQMEAQIREKGLFFLNECGLDPGIDHMSAKKIIDQVKANQGEILSFKSFAGGLLSPECEDNPWKYKFTWNPRNVVLAGQGMSRYIEQSKLKYIPYHQLFKRAVKVSFDELGDFEGYPNRDSLAYRKLYGLENIPTMLRGTLRRTGFTKAWDVLIELGLTDDSIELNPPSTSTKRDFLNSFLPFDPERSVEEKLSSYIPDMDFPTFEKIQWLGLFSHDPLPIYQGSPAQILQAILEKEWTLKADDRDMIVMQHQFEIKENNSTRKLISSLVVKGENSDHTAMAKTVGLPLAIAVDLFLEGEIQLSGLHLPIIPEIYLPILDRLADYGIHFDEKVLEN
ncbi:saccharopine dehydrogenase C-terminal domain-containing protein [Algoriphagus limi]|uniref:Saccharopine dehydrogenase NADP-binding domain-containing protein n=1 Tax=Algoriphagus limi TaxID=2975273 RepID=A0ABT2G8C0_9BACT|nr:saccharopine dehydrogenase C-terminal domain-containing protein [Algoriphagus limi]MCS5491444.1 saccharopine dehydrogenase NADP-binding domain-containing protein [Algoriphagus limi]